MQKLIKGLLLPFKLLSKMGSFLFEALATGLGIAVFLAVSAGMIIGIVGFFAGVFETIKSGNPALLILAVISAIFSGICYKIFNRIMFTN